MTENIRQSIESIYAAFSSVPKPKSIDGCRCCIENKQLATLLAKPLRELSAEELSSYASSVFLTVGSEADYRYFLPRILEILVSDQTWWPDPEVALRTLTLAEWLKWPDAEKRSILRLFEAHFDQLIAKSDGYELDAWLCSLARAEIALPPYLTKLASSQGATLAVYVCNAKALLERRLENAFWEDAPREAMKEIVDFFYSIETSLLILQTYGVDLHLPRFN